MQFVIDAVYAFAHALDALRADVCPPGEDSQGLCHAARVYDGGQFYKDYLLKVDFQGIRVIIHVIVQNVFREAPTSTQTSPTAR